MKTATTQQIEDAAFLVRNRRACLFSEPGTGKTLTAITARKALDPEARTLVIAPKIALHQWQKELLEQGLEAYVFRDSREFKRLEHARILVTTWALMAINAEALKAWGPVVIIADESHACIDYDSKRTQAFFGKFADGSGLANGPEWCWLLSGTPIVRFADDLWPTMRALFPERLDRMLGKTARAAFTNAFVQYRPQRVGGGKTVSVAFAGKNEEKLFAEIYGQQPPMAVRRTLAEVDADMPDLREKDIEIEISREDEAALRAMIGGMTYVDLAKDTEEVKSIRRAYGRAKINPTIEYLETIDEPVLVLTWHQDVTDALSAAFAGSVTIDGRTSAAGRTSALEAFANGSTRMMIGQIGAVGTALDGLQHACRRVVFVERIGSPALMGQAIARVQRRGQRQSVTVEYIRADHALEVVTDQTLAAKTATQARAIG